MAGWKPIFATMRPTFPMKLRDWSPKFCSSMLLIHKAGRTDRFFQGNIILDLHHCVMFVLEPCTTARYLCSFFSGNAIYPAREAAAGEASSRLLFEDNGFKLRLEQLEMSDAANYSCQAENFYGRDSITYHLQVKCKKNSLLNFVVMYLHTYVCSS